MIIIGLLSFLVLIFENKAVAAQEQKEEQEQE